MRKVININENWTFIKEGKAAQVNLPHTWNAEDGQAGGFYYRGKCLYVKELPAARGITYIEFNGANSVTEVYVNGKKAGEHCGGYSVFRFDLTAYTSISKTKACTALRLRPHSKWAGNLT